MAKRRTARRRASADAALVDKKVELARTMLRYSGADIVDEDEREAERAFIDAASPAELRTFATGRANDDQTSQTRRGAQLALSALDEAEALSRV